jgi:DNA-binding transcriptional LysR family regulator
MQIESLKMFCDLAETESFTKAAQINKVTQSAVSQQVSALERYFKTILIERTKKQFRLTHEGQLLYQCCKQILENLQAFEAKLQEMKGIVTGSISIATIYSAGLHNIANALKQFMRLYPQVNVRVEYRQYKQIYDEILRNIVDIGFVAYPVNEPGINVIPFSKDKLVIACSIDNPLANLKAVHLKKLDGMNFVGFDSQIPTRLEIDNILSKYGVKPHYIMEFDNIETVKRAVEIDIGVSILPQNTITQEVATGTIAQIEILDGAFYRPIAMLIKKNKPLTPALAKFLEILQKNSEYPQERSTDKNKV